ncbi:MAG: acetylglutamate kinase [Planctomycetes bacterium]|nr:acetylglutamate kinase [Planctomycetota bacterium]
MRILVKIGGAQLEQAAPRAALARSLARAKAAGHELVVVHGGGNQIREQVKKLGLEERYHEGLRVTDAATADVVTMVLAGIVNKELVLALNVEGLRAAGLSGADGGSFSVAKTQASVDLGYVGSVVHADRALVEALLEGAFTPVIATVAPLARDEAGARDHLYNVNADMAAGPLARTFECDALLFLTDVPGVLDGAKQRLATLTPARAAALRAEGVVTGGMIPKVEMALAALAELAHLGGGLVKIAPAAGDDAVLAALHDSIGTRFVPDSAR